MSALTCDALGVCQDRTPLCNGCKPSEGTRTARLLLDEYPLAERPPFYIFPRTLEEAFGPGQRSLNDGPKPMDPPDRIVVRASGFATAFLVAILLAACGTYAPVCKDPIYGCNSGNGGKAAGASTGTAAGGMSAGTGSTGSTGGTTGGTSPGGSTGTAPGKGDSPGKGDGPGKGHGHGKGHGGHGGHGGKGGKK